MPAKGNGKTSRKIKSEGYLGSLFLGKIFYSYDWIITVSADDLELNPHKVTQ
jgi:hypothetical protein